MTIIRKIILIILSIILIIAPPLAYASPLTWSSDVKFLAGQLGIEAIKGNIKSAIKVAPSAKTLGKFALKGGGAVAVAYAISKALDATDYVLDPANNAVRVKATDVNWEYRIDGKGFGSAEDACKHIWSSDFLSSKGYKKSRLPNNYSNAVRGNYYYSIDWVNAWVFRCYVSVDYLDSNTDGNIGGWVTYWSGDKWATGEVEERSVSMDDIAQHVIDNAKAGHVQSQQALIEATKQAVRAGEYDEQLQAHAVPINGADGVDGVDGKDGENGKDGKDGKDAPPLDTSGIINAISSLADRLSGMFGRLEVKADSIVYEQQDIKRLINTQTQTIIDVQNETRARLSDVVTGVQDVGQKVDKQGQLITGAIDHVADVIELQTDVINTQTDAITQAIEAKEFGLSDKVINDALDRLIADNKANADAIKDAIKDNVKSTDKVADKLDKINEFINDDSIDKPDNTDLPINDLDIPTNTVNINFGGSCPNPVPVAFSLAGRNLDFAIPYTPVCDTAIMLNPVIKLASMITAIFILSGIKKG